MTTTEFRTIAGRYRKRMLAGGLLVTVLYIAAMALAVDFVSVWLMNRTGWPSPMARALCVALLLFVGAPAVGVFWYWMMIRFSPVRCPHCGNALTNYTDLVTATRHCHHCGRRVLVDPDPAKASTIYATMEDLYSANAANARHGRLLLGTFAGLGIALGILTGAPALGRALLPYGAVWVDAVHLAAFAMIGAIGVPFYRRLRAELLTSHVHRCCPAYHLWRNEIREPITVASRCCPGCGKREVASAEGTLHGAAFRLEELAADAPGDRGQIRAYAVHWGRLAVTIAGFLLLILFERMLAPVVFYAGMAAVLLISFAPTLWLLLRTVRRICPSCGGNLLGSLSIVMASRGCPHCGVRIVRED